MSDKIDPIIARLLDSDLKTSETSGHDDLKAGDLVMFKRVSEFTHWPEQLLIILWFAKEKETNRDWVVMLNLKTFEKRGTYIEHLLKYI